MLYQFFLGRFQPFHPGHKACVEKMLEKNIPVCIALRETKISKDNPYTIKDRKKMIRKMFPDKEKVKIIKIPDICSVNYGRKVGYKINKIQLDSGIEAISGTKIRNNNKKKYDYLDIR